MKNIVLVGLMGAGKSSVGKLLAERLNFEFLDSDYLIELKSKMSVSEIFLQKGEEYFRQLEKEVIAEISTKDFSVISTGGGSLENPENLTNIKKNGFVVYLKASPEALFERVKNEIHRPLLRNEKPLLTLKTLLKKREKNYLKADLVLETEHKKIDTITNEIVKVYNENA